MASAEPLSPQRQGAAHVLQLLGSFSAVADVAHDGDPGSSSRRASSSSAPHTSSQDLSHAPTQRQKRTQQPGRESGRTTKCICGLPQCGTNSDATIFRSNRPKCTDGEECGGLGANLSVCICHLGFRLPDDLERRKEWVKSLMPGISEADAVKFTSDQYLHVNHFRSNQLSAGEAGRINVLKGQVPHATPQVSPTAVRHRKRRAMAELELSAASRTLISPPTASKTTRGAQRQINTLHNKLTHMHEEQQKAKQLAHEREMQLEKTEHALLRLDDKLQRVIADYEKLRCDYVKMENEYSGADRLKLAKEALEKQVETLQEAVRERDCKIDALCEQLQSRSILDKGHMSFNVLGDRGAFSDDRVRILTNFHSWETLNGFYELVVNHERAAEEINLWGDAPLQLKRKPRSDRTWTPEDCFLFTVMHLKIGMDMNKLCAWFNWSDEFVSLCDT